MPKPNPYKPIYSVKKSSKNIFKVQRATQKLSVDSINELCLKLGFSLTMPQLSALYEYVFLLQKWNLSMNLVGKSTWEDIIAELIVDSLHLAKYLYSHPFFAPSTLPFNMQNEKLYSFQYHENEHRFSVWDLGAGAGLPGIPLRILWNQGTYTLVEAREKRALFLNMVCTKLGLENTFVCRDRAENFMAGKKAKLIISRAFMPYEKMLDFVAPYLASQNENGAIIFLTLEKINASKFNTDTFQWNTKNIYTYTVQNKKKYFCEIEKITN
jgi:16S rRNA (guanine527-N7)-methyltransferase